MFAFHEGGDSACDENAACGIELPGDVVGKNFFNLLFRWLGCVVVDLFESFVHRREDGVVGSSAVEKVNKIVILTDQLGKLSSVLA